MELLKEIKALSANYQLASYQAAINKNIDKLTELTKLNLHEKLEYSARDEIQNLEYDKIFQDKFPDDVIYDLLDASTISKFLKNLSVNDPEFYREAELEIYDTNSEALNVREENFKQVLQHPLLNYCPNPSLGINILDSLASVTYSKDFSYQEFINGLYNILKKDPIFITALSAIALSSSLKINEKNQFSTILISGSVADFDLTKGADTGGYFNFINNGLLISNQEGTINFEFDIHEKFHYLFDMVYNNNSNPVKADNKEQLDLYHKAIKEVLLNIHDFVKREFSFNLKINSNESSWEIGKKLALLLFPEQITKQNLLGEYVKLLDENNLD